MRLANGRGYGIRRRDRAGRQLRIVDVLAPTSASRPSSSCVQTRLPSRRITRARHGGSSSSPTSSQSPGRGSNVGSSARGPWLIHVSTTRSAPTLVASYHRSYRPVSRVFSLSLVVRVGRSGCRGVSEVCSYPFELDVVRCSQQHRGESSVGSKGKPSSINSQASATRNCRRSATIGRILASFSHGALFGHGPRHRGVRVVR